MVLRVSLFARGFWRWYQPGQPPMQLYCFAAVVLAILTDSLCESNPCQHRWFEGLESASEPSSTSVQWDPSWNYPYSTPNCTCNCGWPASFAFASGAPVALGWPDAGERTTARAAAASGVHPEYPEALAAARLEPVAQQLREGSEFGKAIANVLAECEEMLCTPGTVSALLALRDARCPGGDRYCRTHRGVAGRRTARGGSAALRLVLLPQAPRSAWAPASLCKDCGHPLRLLYLASCSNAGPRLRGDPRVPL